LRTKDTQQKLLPKRKGIQVYVRLPALSFSVIIIIIIIIIIYSPL